MNIMIKSFVFDNVYVKFKHPYKKNFYIYEPRTYELTPRHFYRLSPRFVRLRNDLYHHPILYYKNKKKKKTTIIRTTLTKNILICYQF